MPTQATHRRDPSKTGKGNSRPHGFTVIELMISLTVLAIITALAIPSYEVILEKRQVTSGAEQIGAFLSQAQMESVKRNQFIAVNFQDDGGEWCLGIRAGNNGAVTCDCTITDAGNANACALDGALKVLNSSSLSHPDLLQNAAVGDDDTVVFDPVRGLMQSAETVGIELQSKNNHYALDVEVAVTGRVKICSNNAEDKDVPGYRQCSA